MIFGHIEENWEIFGKVFYKIRQKNQHFPLTFL